MPTVTEFNGYIYLNGFATDLWWCENTWNDRTGESQSIFPLNKITREHFKQEILPDILSGKAQIDHSLYEKIRTFKQNPPMDKPIAITASPQGITLLNHQVTAVDYMSRYNRYGFFLGTGTGKTLIAITWLMNAMPKTALIITPQKVVGQYKKELDKYIPGNNYIVTNYEQLPKLIGNTYEALILDESHRAKSFTSLIHRNCQALADKAKYVYLFTGTPQDRQRDEILAQLSLLDKRVMPTKTRILDRYFHINDYFKPEREKKEFKSELTEIILSYTWGRQTEEVVKLTDKHEYVINCKHPEKYYDEMNEDRLVEDGDWHCVADNPGTHRLVLREICCGYMTMKDFDMNEKKEVFGSTKPKELSKLISSIDKGIIYYEFTASLNEIEPVLKSLNKTYVVVNGSCSAKKSSDLIEEFKKGNADYLVIQSRSGNAGLDLTNVNNIIFYALPESYIVYHQCCSRTHRIGQTKECNYYYLICENTVEGLIYNCLRRKKSLTDKVYKQYINKGDKLWKI